MLDSSHFTYLKFELNMPELITEINEYVKFHIKDFYYSPNKNFRINFHGSLEEKFKKLMPFEISDLGCYQNFPGWKYPLHRDTIRLFSINMVLVDESSDFDIRFVNEDKSESYPIPYIKNQMVLLNTTKLHYVRNNSKTETRFCVSIGCTTINYNTIRQTFEKNGNIGLYQYADQV